MVSVASGDFTPAAYRSVRNPDTYSSTLRSRNSFLAAAGPRPESHLRADLLQKFRAAGDESHSREPAVEIGYTPGGFHFGSKHPKEPMNLLGDRLFGGVEVESIVYELRSGRLPFVPGDNFTEVLLEFLFWNSFDGVL